MLKGQSAAKLYIKYTYIDEVIYIYMEKIITYPKIKNNKYTISDIGVVKIISNNKIMKPYLDKDGYYKITLVSDQKSTVRRGNSPIHVFIHRLVAWEFIGCPIYKNLCVNHINGIKSDNSSLNLEWVTILENTNHAKKMGLLNNSGIFSKNCKYDSNLIHKICKYLENGYSVVDIFEKISTIENYHMNMGLYSLINKLSNRMIYKDIVSQYKYDSKIKKYKRNSLDSEIIKFIEMGYDNYEILDNITDDCIKPLEYKKMYMKIIYLRSIFN